MTLWLEFFSHWFIFDGEKKHTPHRSNSKGTFTLDISLSNIIGIYFFQKSVIDTLASLSLETSSSIFEDVWRRILSEVGLVY